MRANGNERGGEFLRGERTGIVGQTPMLWLFALMLLIAPQAMAEERADSIPWQLSFQRAATSADASRPAGGGGGGDIVVWDIVDSVVIDTDRIEGGAVLLELDDGLLLVEVWDKESVQLGVMLRYSF